MRYLQFFLILGFLSQLASCDRNSQVKKLPKLHEYDDCVLQYMSDISSDVAARAIQKSCKAQSGVMANQDLALPPEAISQLDGNGNTLGDSFSGRIYNGNSDWIITQMTIAHIPVTEKGAAEGTPLQYTVNVNVNPLTVEDFTFPILNKHLHYSWAIMTARGIKTSG